MKTEAAKPIQYHGRLHCIGECCCYDSAHRVIVLTRLVAEGDTAWALVHAAHEASHVEQHREYPWLFWWPLRWFTAVEAWKERDVWARATRMLEKV